MTITVRSLMIKKIIYFFFFFFLSWHLAYGNNIKIDHVYMRSAKSDLFGFFENLGFVFTPDIIFYEKNSLKCRYIYFGNNFKPEGYLEICKVVDLKKLTDTYKNKTLQQITRPAFALSIVDLQKYFKTHKNLLAQYQAEYSHVAYPWLNTTDNTAPGWNFIEMAKDVIPDIDFWFIENEPGANTKKQILFSHPNHVTQLKGIILNLTSLNEAKPFTQLLNQKNSSLIKFNNHQFIKIIINNNNRFQTIVLTVSNIGFFKNKKFPHSKWIYFDGKKCLLYKLPFGAWNILFVPA